MKNSPEAKTLVGVTTFQGLMVGRLIEVETRPEGGIINLEEPRMIRLGPSTPRGVEMQLTRLLGAPTTVCLCGPMSIHPIIHEDLYNAYVKDTTGIEIPKILGGRS